MAKKDPFDFSNLFTAFDPAEATRQFQSQFQAMFENSPFSHLDQGDFAESQRKNLEALLKAQQVAMEGARTIVESQAEMLQRALAEAADTIQKMSASTPGDLPEKNVEAVEKAFDQSVENFNEISAMVESLYSDLTAQVEERVKENIATLKESLDKVAKT